MAEAQNPGAPQPLEKPTLPPQPAVPRQRRRKAIGSRIKSALSEAAGGIGEKLCEKLSE